MPATGSYERGEQPRSVLDPLSIPYATAVAKQKAYNARQAAELEQRRRAATSPTAKPFAGGAPLADRMYRPEPDDIAELRRRQTEFTKTERAISRDNAWMAVPVLAPAAAVLGLEAAGMVAARLAPAAVARPPLQLVKPDPYLRVGDNWATRAGRRAHAALREQVAQKPGWEYEPKLARPGQRPLKPDLGTPQRDPVNPARRKYIELKPDSPSGRAAGARALQRYQNATKDPVRLLFYNLKDFI